MRGITDSTYNSQELDNILNYQPRKSFQIHVLLNLVNKAENKNRKKFRKINEEQNRDEEQQKKQDRRKK